MLKRTRKKKGAAGKYRRSENGKERDAQDIHSTRWHRVRVQMALWAFIAVYATIGVRLVRLQIDPDLKFGKEDLKHIGVAEIRLPRGNIYDRRGRVLATDRAAISLSANPSLLDNPDQLAAALSNRVRLEPGALSRLARRDAQGNRMKFVWLKRWLTEEEVLQLGDISELPGGHALSLQQESVRSYPENDLAAHTLGFANREGVGVEGIELSYDKYLRSQPGRRVSRVDNRRNFLGFLTLEYEPPTGGHDVYLTIDTSLQYTLERALDKAMTENRAKFAMGLLMDPDTGAILALATRPAFDPNYYGQYAPEERKNRAVVEVFEPGSSFKIVTAAAALEQGLITPRTEIDAEGGSFNPYGHRIRDVHKLGVAPFSVCFAQSSNIATIKVAAMLGPERMESWIKRFGFGRRTYLDLPGESPGIFRPRREWSRLSMGSLPMGQEIAVTMPQMAAAFSVIANGGRLVRPHVVDRVVSKEGVVQYRHPRVEPRHVLSAETAETMRELCHLVVSGDNTGRAAAILEYRVGGKTGTAQIAKPGGGGYYRGRRDKYTTIFAGFGPIGRPRVTCVIVVSEPDVVNHYGGAVCGPVFREVVRDALVKMNVPEDRMEAPIIPMESWPSDGYEWDDPDVVVARVDLDALEPPEWDRLDVAADPPLGLNRFAVDGTNWEDRQYAPGALPNFIGMTKRQAKETIVSLDLQWDPRGAGRVLRQEPPAGTPLEEVSVCRLVFSSGA